MRRVAVVGSSGSGKTTIGRALAQRLDMPFTELDSIYHQAGWRPLPREEFRERVAAIAAGDRWVLDGTYSAVRDLVWARADTVVWFDLPRHTVMRQIIRRTLRRVLTRQDLWNGNRESARNLFRLDPHESILLWAWTRHPVYRQRLRAAACDPAYAHLTFVRIASRADASALLAGAGPACGSGGRPELGTPQPA